MEKYHHRKEQLNGIPTYKIVYFSSSFNEGEKKGEYLYTIWSSEKEYAISAKKPFEIITVDLNLRWKKMAKIKIRRIKMICANSYAEHQYNAYEEEDERFDEVGEYAEEFVARFGEDYMYQMPYSAVKIKANDLEEFLLDLEEHEKTYEYINSQAFYDEWFKDYFVNEFVEKFGNYIDSDLAETSEIYEAFSDALSEEWENIKKQVIAKIKYIHKDKNNGRR